MVPKEQYGCRHDLKSSRDSPGGVCAEAAIASIIRPCQTQNGPMALATGPFCVHFRRRRRKRAAGPPDTTGVAAVGCRTSSQRSVLTQSLTHTVLPKPAGADSSVICRLATNPSFRRWTRWGRRTRLGEMTGRCSLVARRRVFTASILRGSGCRCFRAAREEGHSASRTCSSRAWAAKAQGTQGLVGMIARHSRCHELADLGRTTARFQAREIVSYPDSLEVRELAEDAIEHLSYPMSCVPVGSWLVYPLVGGRETLHHRTPIATPAPRADRAYRTPR